MHNGDYRAFGIAVAILLATGSISARSAGSPLTTGGYELLTQRVVADRSHFFVYEDADSGFNHGFPSGFIGTEHISINPACIDDPNQSQGCSSDTTRLNKTSGTVFQIVFPSLPPGNWAGLDFEEPQGYVSTKSGIGYNLTGATRILFSFRSPTGITVQFGAGNAAAAWTTPYVTLPKSRSYTTGCIALQQGACPSNINPLFKLALNGTIDLTSVNLLFTAVTNDVNAPNGGTLLLDNIRYDPVPTMQTKALSLPLSTQTFGLVPAQQPPIPPDQVNRNIAALYEASLAILAFLERGTPADIANAKIIADALVYAVSHDNSGDPLPTAPDGATGLHNAYEAGDLTLLNSQGPGGGQAGQIRFAGFSVTSDLCGSSHYCLVLDGATGGNNAFAVVALLRAYQRTANLNYLNAALTIGSWIYENLLDSSGTGFGGYFLGYPDMGATKVLQLGKSTENNADIFAAFSALSQVESALGNTTAASEWTARAKIAGDFVINMFDGSRGCFNAGTVPAGTQPGSGIDPTGATRGSDVINVFDFFDANSFTWLAMSQSTQYSQAISWSSVVSCLNQFQVSVSAAGQTFAGYSLVKPTTGPQGMGVAWEFTGQAAVVIKLSGGDPTSVLNNLLTAQAKAPFGDKKGLVAATLASGNALPPAEQCLSTPFQCIPERVGIAATVWAIAAAGGFNPL